MELPTSALTIPPFVVCNIYLGKLLITPHKQPEASISSVLGFPEALMGIAFPQSEAKAKLGVQ